MFTCGSNSTVKFHKSPHEAGAHDHDDFMVLSAMVGDEALEAFEFGGFILWVGRKKCSPVGEMKMALVMQVP